VRAIPTPAYLRIADELRRQILDGTLAPGSRLPTIAELSGRYGVSDRTAYEATKVLLNEGLTVSRPGTATVVRDRPAVRRMTRSWYVDPVGGSPWQADMAAQGRTGAWRSRSEPVPARPALAERLRIAAGERVMRTEYTFLADGDPTYLSTSWEPLAITGGTAVMLPEDGPYAGRGVAERMDAIGHAYTHATEEISPRTLTGPEAERLHLRAGTPALLIERTYWEGELPLETADIVIPPSLRPVYQIPRGPGA
jgi:DNA-binding GntR family transcriptional regulator